MASKNGTKPKKAKPEFISRSEVAAVLGVSQEIITKQHVINALTFTKAFDEIVSELFTEDWFVNYAETGEKRLSMIPVHGLSAGSIWSDSMLIEPDEGGETFVEGFAAAFLAIIKWHGKRSGPVLA